MTAALTSLQAAGCVIGTCRRLDGGWQVYWVVCVADREHVCLHKRYEMARWR